MDSPTPSPSIANYYYKNFLADEGDSTDEEVEQEAVTSACELAARYFKHYSEPQRKILPREYIQRDRQAANDRLIKDYFAKASTYPNPEVFRRRFRMSKHLFLRIVEDLENTYDYFKQKADAKKTLGFTDIQKCTLALWVLGYGNTTDINDEYLKTAEKTTRDTLEHFCKGHPLRSPLRVYKNVGTTLMIGSLDCRHCQWYNCPTAWRGQHTRGDQDGPTVIFQAVASQDLWVWSAYFGVAWSCNDLNVFEQSPLVEYYISGRAAKASFYANGNYYPHGYYLCDGIYPKYSIVVKTFRDSYNEKRAHFKKVQESSQKDIERCFGVLQQRWHYLRNPCRA
ncbi:uncharacterized protein LOC110914192 [Helianthus annuus]|uniref:uncharacterized protein LOC110914192 n=1 Tax=Helianthus annuus TaxID=4232 RepID=UPI000B9068EA|nr:uncharacterized protein LOC110914192 [Helianthus annuus]